MFWAPAAMLLSMMSATAESKEYPMSRIASIITEARGMSSMAACSPDSFTCVPVCEFFYILQHFDPTLVQRYFKQHQSTKTVNGLVVNLFDRFTGTTHRGVGQSDPFL